MNGKAPKRCRQKRVLMIPAHYRIKASDAFGPGSPHRLRWHERRSREVAPADTKTEYALVAQLDSVSASDAEGRGGARRRRRRTSAEQSPSERQRPFARSIPAVYYNLIFYALVAQLDSVSASDAEGCGGARRRRRRTSAEQSPSERQRPFARSIPAVYYNLIFYALVAQLDSVSASDAEGCGFDPRRVHHKKSPIAGFFYGLSCPTRPPPASGRRPQIG